MFKAAAVQMSMSESMKENYSSSLRYIRQAAESGAQLVCFPEGQLSRYAAQYRGLKTADFALSLEHPYVRGLCNACRENDIYGCLSLCLSEMGRIYSAALLVSRRGELLAIERKKHIVSAPHFHEQDYFSPGSGGFLAVDTELGRLGMIVCFDRHYPESFRSLALQGCELVVVPVANEKSEPGQLFQWEMRVPAFQNGMFTLMVNRVGTEGAMEFAGESVFAGPEGELITAAADREELLLAELDLGRCAGQREKSQYLKLRRPEVFSL